MSLKEYIKKRNFSRTNEPKGDLNKDNNNRFVIQYHQARTNHYDFRLEYGGVLLSWAVPKGLSQNEKDKRLAVHVEDHPVDYISFAGTIPKGQYGAGSVEIFDNGTYEQIENFKSGLKNGKLKFYLHGKVYNGVWTLIKKDEKNWLIIKSENSVQNIKKNKKLPVKNIKVQLAKLSNEIPVGEEWLFEIKYDGYRIVAFIENGIVKLKTRNGLDYTNKFPNIVKELQNQFQNINVILDGEIVVFDSKGRSDFSMLQNAIKNQEDTFNYVIFDLLVYKGEDIRKKTLLQRKDDLKLILKNSSQNLIYSDHVIGNGKKCFTIAKKKKLEGIIAKKIDSQYLGDRNEDWLKIKCYKRQEFVICGYTTTQKNNLLSSIIVGYYNNKKLTFIGKVGTGFDNNTKKMLNKLFQKLKTNKTTIQDAPKETIFVKPELIAEIQYAELTKSKILRQPSFVGLREDKKPRQVVLENE